MKQEFVTSEHLEKQDSDDSWGAFFYTFFPFSNVVHFIVLLSVWMCIIEVIQTLLKQRQDCPGVVENQGTAIVQWANFTAASSLNVELLVQGMPGNAIKGPSNGACKKNKASKAMPCSKEEWSNVCSSFVLVFVLHFLTWSHRSPNQCLACASKKKLSLSPRRQVSITWVELVYEWHPPPSSRPITLMSQKWNECI